MSNNLVSFLVENNYAPNEISALKILCCVSSSFYEDLVCESMAMNPQQRREYNELMAKKAAGKATPADLSKIEKLLGTLSRQSEVQRRADTREAGRELLNQMTGRSKAPSSSGDSETPPPGLDALIHSVQTGSRTPQERQTANPEHTITGGGYAQTGRRGRIGPDPVSSAGSTSNIQPGMRTVYIDANNRQVPEGTPGSRPVQVGGSAGEVIRRRFGDTRGRSGGGATTPKNPTVR